MKYDTWIRFPDSPLINKINNGNNMDIYKSGDEPYLSLGELVEFSNTDAYYKGKVVCVFEKLNGSIRCVVEDDRGLLLIKNPLHAKPVKENE